MTLVSRALLATLSPATRFATLPPGAAHPEGTATSTSRSIGTDGSCGR